jgi:eukaryotic-like serine/threonine-protein kinase
VVRHRYDPQGPMRTIGPYSVLEELGRGGQGVVYLAEDTRLNRKVALKVIETVGPDMPTDRLQRFHREAEAASKLDHPNICGIHEAGEANGVHYIAMRYVEGETLAHQIEAARDKHDTDSTPSTRDDIHTILVRMEKVARALHIAHEHGLIHRDIKPGNIMLTSEDEPVVLDFGLARDEFSGTDLSLTQSGDLLGTPAYMSPEQLMAQRIPLDSRTDVYSLGATLYECLTLNRPYEALTRAELYQRILTDDPPSASSLNRAIPRDLQIVLDTAIEKNRDRRYQSALALAEDLRRVREFKPIAARPISRFLRVKRWSQRHPGRAVGIGALIALLCAALVLVIQQRASLTESRALGLAAAASAERDGSLVKLMLALEAVRGQPDNVRTISALVGAFHSAPEVSIVAENLGLIRRIVVDPKQRFVAFVSHERFGIIDTQSVPGAPILLQENAALPGSCVSHDIAFNQDASRLLVVSAGSALRVFDVGTKKVMVIPCDAPVTCGRFTAKGNGVVVGCRDGRLLLYSFDNPGSPRMLARQEGPVIRLDIDGEDKYIAVAGLSWVRVWNFGEPQPFLTRRFEGEAVMIHTIRIAPDGEYFYACSQDRTVRVWRLPSGNQLNLYRESGGAVNDVSISESTGTVVAASSDLSVRVFGRSGDLIATFRGHSSQVRAVGFLSDNRFVSGALDGTIRVWRAPFVRHLGGQIQGVRFLGTGVEKRILAVSRYGTARTWNSAGIGSKIARFAGTRLTRLKVSRDGTVAAAEKILDPGLGDRVLISNITGVLEQPDPRYFGDRLGDLSPDGSQVASIDGDGFLRIRSILDARVLFDPIPVTSVASASFSTDGKSLVYVQEGRLVNVWTPPRKPRTLTDVPGLGKWVRFSPRGDRILVWGIGHAASLITREGQPVTQYRGHGGQVMEGCFSPDGLRVFTASRDGTARMWNTDDGTLLATFEHPAVVYRLDVSSDWLVTGSSDGNVRLFRLDFDGVIEDAERRLMGQKFDVDRLNPYRQLLGSSFDAWVAPAAAK